MNDHETAITGAEIPAQPQSNAAPAPLFAPVKTDASAAETPLAQVQEPEAEDVEGWIKHLENAARKPGTVHVHRFNQRTGNYEQLPPPMNASTFTVATLSALHGAGEYRLVIKSTKHTQLKQCTLSIGGGAASPAPAPLPQQPAPVQGVDPAQIAKMIQEATEAAEERADKNLQRTLDLVNKLGGKNAAAPVVDPFDAMLKASQLRRELKDELKEELGEPAKARSSGGTDWGALIAQGLSTIAAMIQANKAQPTQAAPSPHNPSPSVPGGEALQRQATGPGAPAGPGPQGVGNAATATPTRPPTPAPAQTPPAATDHATALQAVFVQLLPSIAYSARKRGNVEALATTIVDAIDGAELFDYAAENIEALPVGTLAAMLNGIAGDAGPIFAAQADWVAKLETAIRAEISGSNDDQDDDQDDKKPSSATPGAGGKS